ncbi:MAG: glycosyltransferase family 2 protein, partial [Acidimicrobiales bacterium]
MVVSYDKALEDPKAWQESTVKFLESIGMPLGDTSSTEGSHLEPSARHQGQGGPHRETSLLTDQQALVDVIESLEGSHSRWRPPEVANETEWTGALLAEKTRLHRLADDVSFYQEALGWAVDTLSTVLSPDLDDERKPLEYPRTAMDDNEAYWAWLRRHATKPLAVTDSSGPLISVVVPTYKPEPWFLERCIDSVRHQTYPNWEMCICDDGSDDPSLRQFLKRAAKQDSRLKITFLEANSGISTATNRALELANGDYVAFVDHDDELPGHALARVANAIAETPEADLVYSDEDKLDGEGRRVQPTFKPDWSPDWLLSHAYICHLLVVRRALVAELGGMRSEFDGSQDYDLT